jgi:hypothetical protein
VAFLQHPPAQPAESAVEAALRGDYFPFRSASKYC